MGARAGFDAAAIGTANLNQDISLHRMGANPLADVGRSLDNPRQPCLELTLPSPD
jgi:hypothetical protein